MPEARVRRQLREHAELVRALDESAPLRLVLRRDGPIAAQTDATLERAERAGIEVRRVSQRQLTRLAQGSGEPEFLALLGGDPRLDLDATMAAAQVAWLLTGTAYPGNAGFVIRTAEVSGADGVVIDAGFDHEARRSVRRTAMRADRYMPLHYDTSARAIEAARSHDLRIVGIEDSGTASPWEVDLRPPALYVLGGERHGIPPAVLDSCDRVLRLPMAGFIPSYNLQAAMAMVVGERLRQVAAAGQAGCAV